MRSELYTILYIFQYIILMLDLRYTNNLLSKIAILNSAKNMTEKCELQRCFFLYWNFYVKL